LREHLRGPNDERGTVSLLWIILIVILVLALLGFFTRGRW
jgi:flagellar basal body-associated protein FliL